MRRQLFLVLALLGGVAAAGATEPRSYGAYTSLTLASPAACARACADDGICMTWTYRAENVCDLSAVVSTSRSEGVIASGFSARAPTLALRQLTVSSEPAASPTPVIEAPPSTLVDDAEPPFATTPQQDSLADEEASAMLLGGPDDGYLRN